MVSMTIVVTIIIVKIIAVTITGPCMIIITMTILCALHQASSIHPPLLGFLYGHPASVSACLAV